MTHDLLRELAPQVLGVVTRRFGDFAAAEDAVQEALLAAATQWPTSGVPESPRAWLIHVAGKRMTDQVRSVLARRKRETAVMPEDFVPPPDDAPPEEDDTLLLLFMCCHESLSHASAIALTLRAVGGLTTSEIAHAFFVPEATMAQRISRAKQQIAKSGARLRRPTPAEQRERLASVLHVLYLIFNEGYSTTAGESLQRVDLSNEAIRLARALHHHLPDDGEVLGLLALMRLTDARRAARTGPSGEIVPLDEQDRSTWDRDAIAEGVALVSRALARGAIGPYQLQAAIAAVHDEAERAEDTDWAEILALYGLLERMGDNPMVTLNRAIAMAMVNGPAAGLAMLAQLENDERIADHHRLAATRAHLHERLGHREEAISDYELAAERTANVPERNYLLLKAARIRG